MIESPPATKLKQGMAGLHEKLNYSLAIRPVLNIKESKMRDLVFKNLISNQKKRGIISSSEVVENKGIRSIIRRHFIYMLKEINEKSLEERPPYLYVLKEKNTKAQREKFFCRLKGSVYIINQGKPFLILFMHSLKIIFNVIPQNDLLASSGE